MTKKEIKTDNLINTCVEKQTSNYTWLHVIFSATCFSFEESKKWNREKMRKKEERSQYVHAYNMARRSMVEWTITNHSTLKAFSTIRNIPFSFSTARIHSKIPIFLPNLVPYLLQCLHCNQKIIILLMDPYT